MFWLLIKDTCLKIQPKASKAVLTLIQNRNFCCFPTFFSTEQHPWSSADRICGAGKVPKHRGKLIIYACEKQGKPWETVGKRMKPYERFLYSFHLQTKQIYFHVDHYILENISFSQLTFRRSTFFADGLVRTVHVEIMNFRSTNSSNHQHFQSSSLRSLRCLEHR